MIRRIKREIKRYQKIILIILLLLGIVYYFFIRDPELQQAAAPKFYPKKEKIKTSKAKIKLKTKQNTTIYYEIINLTKEETENNVKLNKLSPEYNKEEKITIEAPKKIKILSFANADKFEKSKVAKKTYEIKQQAEKPNINISSGFGNEKQVRISGNVGDKLYYSLEDDNFKKYSQSIKLDKEDYKLYGEKIKIKAYAKRKDYFKSEIAEKEISLKKFAPEPNKKESIDKKIKIKKIKTGENKKLILASNNPIILTKDKLIKINDKFKKDFEVNIKGIDLTANENLIKVLTEESIITINNKGKIVSKIKLDFTINTFTDTRIRAEKNYFYIGDTKNQTARLYKINRKGKVIFKKKFTGYSTHLTDIEIKGNKILTLINETKNIGTNILLTKLNSEGEILTQNKFGGVNSDLGYNLIVDKNIKIVGETNTRYKETKKHHKNYNIMILKIRNNKLINRRIIGGEGEIYPIAASNKLIAGENATKNKSFLAKQKEIRYLKDEIIDIYNHNNTIFVLTKEHLKKAPAERWF